MGRSKQLAMTIEDRAWEEISDIIEVSKSLNESLEKAYVIMKDHNLLNQYLSDIDVTNGVVEMWNEK
tara:strand:- start:230 stop:430 length:201 start_codon:yes stop_codon:yes gene_type:complete